MAYTQTDIDRLDQAIASGELSVQTAAGVRIQYRSLDELLTARDRVAASISARTKPAGPRHVLADFSDD